MGRQTGEYLLGTLVFGAVVLFGISRSTTESAILPTRGGFQIRTASATRDFALAASEPEQASNQPRFELVVIRDIQPGTRIVLGSLDVSGSRHRIRVNPSIVAADLTMVADPTSEPLDSARVVRYSPSEIEQGRHQSCLAKSPQSARLEDRDYRRNAQVTNCSRVNDSSRAMLHSRVFLTPHFSDSGTVDEPVECRLAAESDRTRIYVDGRMIGTDSPYSPNSDNYRRLTGTLEERAWPIAENWIGNVADFDSDDKLSIVVTDLDRRSSLASEPMPIHGCIRATDFDVDSEFCGDIIYVDPGIFLLTIDEQAALLAHELTHAAVCSLHVPGQMNPENSGLVCRTKAGTSHVPAWMNEAIAHLIELKCCPQSANFHRRLTLLQDDPSASPIVASESVLSLQERRGGSRCAATLFLSRFLSSPDHVKQFLSSTESTLDQRIQSISDQPFEVVFRDWTLSMATMSMEPEDRAITCHQLSGIHSTTELSLLGTAFLCLECPPNATSLTIEADSTALLQVSVIVPPNCGENLGM